MGTNASTNKTDQISLFVSAAVPVGSTVIVAAAQTDSTLYTGTAIWDSRGNTWSLDRQALNTLNTDARVHVFSSRITSATGVRS